ncbi:flagellar basal body P-ring formation chaperone FlgA [Aliiroseovarius crassostreae]|uniref:flagellar basal body P-ring formation chaperone FlgA n=1 Tax=Aliiroseovarius crassostreae TaxID=154981 RepID=UPI0021B08B86|nr:flagellar basal body P-ring formation chaperone FlgA [Aliiroseovarius crassostreae]UWQ04885.1 flagellar basal body P-ring formation protein FlgA [Aliiroseovarius crassostreae]
MWRFVLALLLLPTAIQADTVLAARTMRANSILTAADLTVTTGDIPGTYVSMEELVGQETRSVLYAGRPIRLNDVGPPALVDRNQIIILIYETGGLRIAAEGRALARGGIGDRVRVMNLSSRSTITGTIQPDGSVSVAPPNFPGF